jgi:copper(I)-binding protein
LPPRLFCAVESVQVTFMTYLKVVRLLMLTLILSACNPLSFSRPSLKIEQAWVKQAKVSEVTAGDLNAGCICDRVTKSSAYLVVRNDGWTADRLTRVESDAAVGVELQDTSQTEVFALPMVLKEIQVPAHGKIEFTPGQYAMLLKDLKHDLQPGDRVRLTLYFEQSGAIQVDAEVR